MPPVTHEPNTAGKIKSRHRCQRPSWKLRVISRRSSGIWLAPAITLNRMYHCVPNAISRILPQLISTLHATNQSVTNGNVKFEGKLASTCTIGCINRETRGFMPIIAPIGTQITEQTSVSSATRRNVTMPNTNACPSSPNPASR